MSRLLNCLRKKKGLFDYGKTTVYHYHKSTLSDLEEEFHTSLARGLSSKEALRLLKQNGLNIITPPHHNKYLRFLSYFFSGFCGVLWFAVIVCILAWKPIGNPPDPTNLGLGLSLVLVIFAHASLTAYQDWASSKVMRSALKIMPQEVQVCRDGQDKSIPADQLVVGDVVYLNYGNKVAADIRIIKSNYLKFDKSMLTGECEPEEGTVECNETNFHDAKNIALMTSLITNGSRKGVVVFKGDDTMIGKITRITINTKNEKTSLQKDISRFSWQLTIMAKSSAVLVIIIWAAVLNVKYYGFLDVSGMLISVISVVVGFVPEGLPLSVTLVLLIMAKKMAKNDILVKNLNTLETLSAVNVICSDKTGTLTRNDMQVTSLLAGLESIEEPMINNERRDINHHLLEHELKLGKKTYSNTIIQVTSMGEIPNDDFLISKIKRSGVTNQLIGLSFLCNNAKYDEITKKIEGNGTDKALMEFAIRNIIGNLKKNYKIQAEIQFTSRNKWMMKTVKVLNHQLHNHFFGDELSENHSSLLLMKGAPEILFKKCKFYISKTGKKFNFTPETEKLIIKTQKKWSSQGQRVLIFIKKPLSMKEESELEKCQLLDLEKKINDINDFEFVGMVGMIDPPREDIYDVMKQIKQAGIKVVMFTGDFYLTAAAIARKIGIFTTSQPDLLSNVRKMEEIVPEKYKSMDLISIKGSMRIENAEINKMFKLVIDPKLPVAKRKKRKPHELKIDEVNSLLLNGSDLDYLSPEDWMFVTKYDEIVFARTSPEQKLKVVTEFQKYGNIVGVTGDGVNDAPSLKKANIGIAMGSGSDVAKEAAELILMDSNFSSILVAIQNGRLIFQNLRKMIIYSLPAGLFAEIMPVLLNIFLGVPQTMSSFQMIIVCIYTDLFPSLAMMMEKPVQYFKIYFYIYQRG